MGYTEQCTVLVLEKAASTITHHFGEFFLLESVLS